MIKLTIGDTIPEFSVKNQWGDTITNASIAGKNVIFYFYPKDDTPGCTTEGNDFSRLNDDFNKKNTIIFGISKDSEAKHLKFCKKYNFKHQLLSDADGALCDAFGVWQEKKMMGKTTMGIVRTTFLIDGNGKISHIWPKVKVNGHAELVLDTLA